MEGSRDRKSKSNKQYFILSGVGHGARRDGHQEKPPGSSLKHSAPPPWAPPPPLLPKFLPCFGKWAHILWVTLPFPENKQALPLSWPPGALAGGAGKKGVCIGEGTEGGSVILLENKLHPFSIFIREDTEQSSTRPRCV